MSEATAKKLNEVIQPLKYEVGEIVSHSSFGYRGVIIRKDAYFKHNPEWPVKSIAEPPLVNASLMTSLDTLMT